MTLSSRWIKIAALTAGLVLIALGMSLFRLHQRNLRRKIDDELAAVTKLKVDQIAAWRQERLADAAIITESPFFREGMQSWLGRSDPVTTGKLRTRLLSFQTYNHYVDVFVVDIRGNILYSLSGRKGPTEPGDFSAVRAAFAGRRPALSDLHADSDDPAPRMEVFAPLFNEHDGRPFGAVILFCDARQFLFPLIQSWPTPSDTAETLLVRKDGDGVLFLNDLRHRKGAALTLRFPLTRTDSPAVRAVTGNGGIFRGKDYRGVDVLSDSMPVPGSPWFLVAKIDAAEAFASFRFEEFLQLGLLLLLVGGIGGIFLYTRQREEKSRFRRLFEAEASRLKYETRYRALFESTSDALMLLDDGGFFDCNQATLALFGCRDKSEFCGHQTSDFSPPVQPDGTDSKTAAKERMALAVENGSHHFEWVHKRLGGGTFPADVLFTRLVFEDRMVLQATVRDISGHRRAEDLAKARLRLAAAPNGTPSKVLMRMALDEMEGLTGSSIGFYHLVEADQETIDLQTWSTNTMGKMCSAEGEGSHYPMSKAGVWADCVRQKKALVHNDFPSVQGKKGFPAGHAAITRELTVPILREGKVVAVLGVGNKTSDYDEFDAEAVVSLGDFSWEIALRRRAEEEKAGMQAELMHSQKMETVGRLAGGVAHNFNNMLWVILGFTELAMKRLASADPIRPLLEEVRKAALRSVDVTRQLLTFSRRQTVEPVVLELNDVVEKMKNMLAQILGEGIVLEWNPGEGLWPIQADPVQLDQILANLAVNARDAMEGGGRVVVETKNVNLSEDFLADHTRFVPGHHILLSFKDTGHGMAKDVLDHLFEPFFTTKKVGRGTGLGLAMIYGIVNQSHGTIKAESEPGKGTAFSIYFPRFVGNPTEAVLPESTETPKGRGEWVLLVEDEPAALKMAESMIQSLGYKVLSAGNPMEALRLAEAHRDDIQLLLTDVIMPGMNGRELAAKVQAIKPGIKCLFMSGYSGEILDLQGLGEEGVHLLRKPFTEKQLATALRKTWNAGKSI